VSRPGLQFVVVDDDINHAVIARTVIEMVVPGAEVQVMTDSRGLSRRLLDAPEGALVMTDRMMGLRESFGMIEAVRERRPDLRFVVLSAALSGEDQARALEAGAVMAVQKPPTVAEWRVLVRRVRELSEEETDSASQSTSGRNDGAAAS